MAQELEDSPRTSGVEPFPAIPQQVRSAGDNPHVRYDMSLDTTNLYPPRPEPHQTSRSDTDIPHDIYSPSSLRRRSTRTGTFRTVDEFDELGGSYLPRRGWQPGSEPGFNPHQPHGGHAYMPSLIAPCQITVVDFSLNNMIKRNFDNESFIQFLKQPQEDWVKCRWININGLSQDVIQAVGAKKKLHSLALEDIMNSRNRTKADWYPNHAFLVLTLQKLVQLVDDDDASDGSSTYSHKSLAALRASFTDFWRTKQEGADLEKKMAANGEEAQLAHLVGLQDTAMMQTLQRYHASGNEARTDFMERHSSLAPYKQAVSAEQISVFLTSDNTVISFFEGSAGDVERPILTRLSTPGTILRESYDGSLLVQAIIDAVIDLAIPLIAVYADIIGDLELDVLTSPTMNQSRRLYICTSEINKMLSFLNPIDNLVNSLRDHKTQLSQEQAMKELNNTASGVIVTPMTHTYLGDVLDHCIMIAEALQQLKQSSDNLISLIFNTISARQNESMKQLSIVTIIFLPLTFITGFFGQNFIESGFPDLHHGIWYFWACAVPTALVTMLVLMRDGLYAWLVRVFQRKQVISIRKRRQRKQQNKHKMHK